MTYDEEEMYRRFVEQERKDKQRELSASSVEIEKLQAYSRELGCELDSDDFDYVQTIGVVGKKNNLLNSLLPDLRSDKDNLYSLQDILNISSGSRRSPGYIQSDVFTFMVHPYFRRGMYSTNNFAPRFVELFWAVDDSEIKAYISLDADTVRVSNDTRIFMEDDTWYGAPFYECIGRISDGIVRLAPPLDLERHRNSFLFKDAYALDIKWSEKAGIKTFQAYEFKQPDIVVELGAVEYHPVRYIHAEFDLSSGSFRHFDGAVHHFTHDEYMLRRDVDFNYGNKVKTAIKPNSKKMFKFNGVMSVEFWSKFCCHYLSGNPLIIEYFTGSYPSEVSDMLERIRGIST